jgi:hypothetical protein
MVLKIALSSTALLALSLNYANGQEVKQPANQKSSGQEVFVPIPASEYTDPNYQINLEKSQQVQQQLDARPTEAPLETKEDIVRRLEQYELERKKHAPDSQEYADITIKMRILQQFLISENP